MNGNQIDVVTMRLGKEMLAVAASNLHEILEPVPVTRVPNAGSFVSGLINVRGAVVPLADLRAIFGMEAEETTHDTRMVVLDVELEGGATTVAILADKVLDVSALDLESVDAAPPVGSRWPTEIVRGIGQRDGEFVILPDLPAIFKSHCARSAEPRKDIHR
ncbi:purine-binding chemotaxis protein CheW [Rhodobacter aestuarii]|uniref:Purine-binding chemotaxis protein CheW n=1 Tax=Rhodobacter aestuarii TaxID=453582 RepID=A0A1N7QD26_9RHOB|nr:MULTISPECIES: chemotaxis protein CheW [Rhodobacter]PTV93573.1 purine-binding chemotaxis protein CheW [Rhodobacter aestuarii]SIT20773.1 purine-binding chemotaxis protein CheW [Rhodobacter aestuarii]SOC16028.1 purine-binding chemotaxis protein CheW [Rhodobacter sp. JA431]